MPSGPHVGLGDGDGQSVEPRVWATNGPAAWAVLRYGGDKYVWAPHAVELYGDPTTLDRHLEAMLFGA